MKKFVLGLICCLFFNAGAAYCTPVDVDFNDGIYHITIKGEKSRKKVKMYASQALMTNEEVHKQSGAVLTVNAGFFDPENGKTISYVTAERQTIEDPMLNENLLDNYILRKNLTKIVNRTEFRIVDCDNKYSYEIVPHNVPVDFTCSIVEAVQGGPLIVPDLRLEEEFFIVKDGDIIEREACSVLHKTARTVLGIKDGDLHILIITDEHPMDMYEVQDLCKKLGFDRAMGLDGGSSTSMDYKDKYHVVSVKGDGGGRRLKSFITVY